MLHRRRPGTGRERSGVVGLPSLIYGRTYATPVVLQNDSAVDERVEIGCSIGHPTSAAVRVAAVVDHAEGRRTPEVSLVITTPPLVTAPKAARTFGGR